MTAVKQMLLLKLPLKGKNKVPEEFTNKCCVTSVLAVL